MFLQIQPSVSSEGMKVEIFFKTVLTVTKNV